MQKVRYELDPYNRLVISGSGSKSDLTKFRKVLDGKFKTDKNNNLSYHIKSPLTERDNIPHQVKLKGEWSLTGDHKLRLTMDKLDRATLSDQITFSGEILDVNANSLLFAVTTRTKKDFQSTYILNLSGSWQADENNRLSFHIRKEKGKYDILTFNGVWELNKNHQIIYQYEKADLAVKKKEVHTITFKGYWDIKEKARISYVLSEGTDSLFNFSASAGIFKEDFIQYELGIGLTNRAERVTRMLTLYGSWNLKKDVGLVFEIDYGDGKIQGIVFGADAKLTDKDTISFRLKNDVENKDLGVTLELSHEILEGDGEAFLRVLKSGKESAIYAGAAWRW